jgi:hypothetical protein
MAIQTKSRSKTSPREVIERAKAEGVQVVDVRLTDPELNSCGCLSLWGSKITSNSAGHPCAAG